MGQLTLWRFGLIHVLFHITRFGETPFFVNIIILPMYSLSHVVFALFHVAHPLNSLQEYMVFYFGPKCFVSYGWVIVNPNKSEYF